MCEKILDLAKDITKVRKQDKIRSYKYHPPEKMGYNEFGAKWDPKALRCCFARKKT